MTDRPSVTIEHTLMRRGDDPDHTFVTTEMPKLWLDRNGVVPITNTNGVLLNHHRGHFARANVRDPGFQRSGEVRAQKFNHRQLTIIDRGDLEHIGDELEIDPDVVAREMDMPRDLFIASRMGMNVVTSSVRYLPGDEDSLNDVRPPYHLGHVDDGGLYTTAVLVTAYNEPCVNPGRAIGAAYPGENAGMGRRFKEVAYAHRGYAAIVSQVGTLVSGQEAVLEPLPVRPDGAE